MRTLWRDLRLGLRALLRRPLFTTGNVLILALGIGSATALFTLVNAIFLNPFPGVVDVESIVAVYRSTKGESGALTGKDNLSYLDYHDVRERNRAFSGFAAYQWWPCNLSGGDRPERVTGMFVSANYFDLLGLQPARGRFFRFPEGETPHQVAVLSHGAWQRLFGSDPDILGRNVVVKGLPLTVVGVAPQGFRGTEIHVNVDAWVPISLFPVLSPYSDSFKNRGVLSFRAFGRLRSGVSAAQAGQDLHRLAGELGKEYPKASGDTGFAITSLRDSAILVREQERYHAYTKNLAIAVTLILLVACINVAGLLSARGIERGRELAVFLALGASRASMVRRLLAETVLLFLLGGLVGLPIGRWSLDLLWGFRPPELAQATLDLGLDSRVLTFAFAITLLTSLLFGLVPAVRASRPDLMAVLREGADLAQRPWHGVRPRNVLVAGQLALALVALLAAAVYLGNLRAVQHLDLGFEPASLLVVTVSPGDQGYSETTAQDYYQRLLDHVSAVPGVRSATLSENRLLRGAVVKNQLYLPGRSDNDLLVSPSASAHRTNVVVPGFFRTVGIALLDGRDFDARDCAKCPRVLIINRTMAERVWPGERAVGKQLVFHGGQKFEIVGVAEDAKYRYIHDGPEYFLYRPLSQSYVSAMTLHVRTASDPAAMLPTVLREVQKLDPNLPLAEMDTMDHYVAGALWMERMLSSLVGLFGLLTLLLAVVGVYTMMANTVAHRRREIGLRLALGAQRSDVLWTVLREAAAVTAAGVALGWGLAWFLIAPASSSQVQGFSLDSLWGCAGQTLLLAVAAILSSWLPARRAAAISPLASLSGR
jgi:macrolide transport system ATP-binding/permease protein